MKSHRWEKGDVLNSGSPFQERWVSWRTHTLTRVSYSGYIILIFFNPAFKPTREQVQP